MAASAGVFSAGAAGAGAGGGTVGDEPSTSTLATNASPQTISGSPALVRSKAPGVVRKSGENVPPVR